MVLDGTGARERRVDVLVQDGKIARVENEIMTRDVAGADFIDAGGLFVTPGFIDAHSHADGGLLDTPQAETQLRQGITTSCVGQDGGHNFPLADWFARVEARRVGINVASFAGHGTLRGEVLGKDYQRPATPGEIVQMRALLAREMKTGALGLSSGLEYEPGLFGTTEEIIALAEVAGIYDGLYISHVRDEENGALKSFIELVTIAERGRLPGQISHIKLASAPVWNKTGEVFRLMDAARSRGVDISADIYPYTYWQSTITTLLDDRNFDDLAAWNKALASIGGPANVLVTSFTPDPTWEGKTLAEIALQAKQDGASVARDLVKRTRGANGERLSSESVVVTAMQEKDLRAFIADKRIMFCTDGGLRGSHPRGAGSYPRVLGRYVRDERVLPLAEAVRKMTSLPASRMRLANRGRVAPGYFADLVVFDPRTVRDTATTKDPRAKPIGIRYVLVNGVTVLQNDEMTGALPGMALRRSGRG